MKREELEQDFDNLYNSWQSLEDQIQSIRSQQEELKEKRANFVVKNRRHITKHLMPTPMATYFLTEEADFEFLFRKLSNKVSEYLEIRFVSNFKDDYPEYSEVFDNTFNSFFNPEYDYHRAGFRDFLVDIGILGKKEYLSKLCCRNIKYVRPQKMSVCQYLDGDYKSWSYGAYPTSKVCKFLDEDFNILETSEWSNTEIPINWIGERAYKTTPKDENKTNIYLMFNNRDRLYKIGRSIKPKVREKTLQSSDPKLELLFYYPATNYDEKHLHKMFKNKRARGEWFDLSAKDVQEIKNYLEQVKTGKPTYSL